MRLLPVLGLLIFYAYCSPSKKITAENVHLTYTPPNGIKVSDSLFCDQTEMTNIGWREYIFWLAYVFGDSSAEYTAALPDTSVWQSAAPCLADYTNSYFRHPMYNSYPVVGITQEQAIAYTKWRTDRVTEAILIRLRKIERNLHPDPNNYFTIEKYFNDSYERALTGEKIKFFPVYRLMTATERTTILKYADSVDNATCLEPYSWVMANTSPCKNDSLAGEPVWPANGSCASAKTGIFNLRGNVSEWLAEPNATGGGGWIHTQKQISEEDIFRVDGANSWTGFRNVCEWKTWDPSLFTEMIPQAKTSIAWTAGWSYDDKYIAVGNADGETGIFETAGWSKIRSLSNINKSITRLEWNPRHPLLAITGRYFSDNDSIAQIFDISTNKTVAYLPPQIEGRCVTWSPDGEKLAFVGWDGKIFIYSKWGVLLKTLSFQNQRSLFDIDWHPTQNLLLAVEENIFLIDIDKDSLIAMYDDGEQNKGILSCQWHPSGNFFVTGDYGHENESVPSYLKYWDINGRLLKHLKETGSEYRNLKWSKDGKYLASASDVLLVTDEKGAVLRKTKFDWNNLWGVDWNSDGSLILTSDGNGNVRISTNQGKVIKQFSF